MKKYKRCPNCGFPVHYDQPEGYWCTKCGWSSEEEKNNNATNKTVDELLRACRECQAWLFDMQTDSENKEFFGPILDVLSRAISNAGERDEPKGGKVK